MSLLTIPNTFANGTGPSNIIDATQMNANFTAVQTAVNNIYPSQVLPLTSGQATFGATATGVGYKFLANDATATPLTVSGIAGQSVPIQSWTLTSGGAAAMAVTSIGALNVGVNSSAGSAGDAAFSRSATTGAILIGQQQLDYGITLAGGFSIGKPLFSGIAAATHTSNYQFTNNNARTTAMGFSNSVSIATVPGTVWLLTDLTNIDAVAVDTSGNMGITGAYNHVSLAAAKANIAPLAFDPLALVINTQWQQFTMASDPTGETLVGFIADNTDPVLSGPQQNRANPSVTASVACAAIQVMAAKLHAAGVAGF